MSRAFVVAAIGLCAAACVPRGDPPAGRQLTADRASVPITIVPPTGDGMTRVLVARAGEVQGSTDLFVIAVDAAGTPPVEQPLARNVVGDPSSGCDFGTSVCFRTDARGRLLLFTASGDGSAGTSMARIDPVTGDRTELGLAMYYDLSPSGQRLLVYPTVPGDPYILYDAEDRAVPLDVRYGGTFVGEVFYYLTAQRDLMRLVPGGTPEHLATAVDGLSARAVDGGAILVLSRTTADPSVSTYSLLDATTLQEIPSPLGTVQFDLSPDGQWLVTTDRASGAITFTNWRTGAQEVSAALVSAGPFPSQWRPGHLELWVPNGPDGPPTTWIITPGAAAVEVPGLAIPLDNLGSAGPYSIFTPDGSRWFSLPDLTGAQGIMVGSADDPTGPRIAITAPGRGTNGYWQTPTGLIVTASWTTTPDAENIYVTDPETGEMRAMGEKGRLVAAGGTRLVVNQHLVDEEGDLTVFDLGTGQATVLAPEFTMSAIIGAEGADSVPPGAPIVFRFQARFPSPYDGLWLATVP